MRYNPGLFYCHQRVHEFTRLSGLAQVITQYHYLAKDYIDCATIHPNAEYVKVAGRWARNPPEPPLAKGGGISLPGSPRGVSAPLDKIKPPLHAGEGAGGEEESVIAGVREECTKDLGKSGAVSPSVLPPHPRCFASLQHDTKYGIAAGSPRGAKPLLILKNPLCTGEGQITRSLRSRETAVAISYSLRGQRGTGLPRRCAPRPDGTLGDFFKPGRQFLGNLFHRRLQSSWLALSLSTSSRIPGSPHPAKRPRAE